MRRKLHLFLILSNLVVFQSEKCKSSILAIVIENKKNLAVMVVGKAQKEVVGMHSMQASKPKRLD